MVDNSRVLDEVGNIGFAGRGQRKERTMAETTESKNEIGLCVGLHECAVYTITTNRFK